MTRFNNGISVVDLINQSEISNVEMHSAEPASITDGRPFLYDAMLSSSHGDSACASCHIDGDLDQLAWDLGNPSAVNTVIPGITGIRDALLTGTAAFAFSLPSCESLDDNTFLCVPDKALVYNSNKGPMTTQTLAGMDNHGPMHWRGDKTSGTEDNPGAQPNAGMFDERVAFGGFSGAFEGVLGREHPLSDEEMTTFTDFVLQNTLPPNPIRNLDNSLTAQQALGKEIYFGGADGKRTTDVIRTCNGCHTLDLKGNAEFDVKRPGFFGGDGRLSFIFTPEMLKVPHLRNMYQKVGMFGLAATSDGFNGKSPFLGLEHQGDQIRGFGFDHAGESDTVFNFLQAVVFLNQGPVNRFGGIPNPGGFLPYIAPGTYSADPDDHPDRLRFRAELNDPFYQQINPETGNPKGPEEVRAVEAFIMAFPSNMAPVVGQQIRVTADSDNTITDRLSMFEERAGVLEPLPECDLIAKAMMDDVEIGFLYDTENDIYIGSDDSRRLRDNLVSAAVNGVTFTCVPPGDGLRLGLDRDLDGYFDTIEFDHNSDPADADSVPMAITFSDTLSELFAQFWQMILDLIRELFGIN